MKFMRWAQWRIDRTGSGILAFITNNTYIDGITHCRMRHSLASTFDRIFILDLHGSITKKEKCPDGSEDENVFDIRQGVGIGVFVKSLQNGGASTIHHADLWGRRSRKYGWLQNNDIRTTDWTELSLEGEGYLFTLFADSRSDEYDNLHSLNNLVLEYISGVQTKKDDLFVAFAQDEIESRMKRFLDPAQRRATRELQEILQGSGAWIEKKAEGRSFSSDRIRPYMVSPFDIRFVYYDQSLLGRARYSVMRHMLVDNIGLAFMRQSTSQEQYDHFLAVRSLVTDRVFHSAHGAPFLAPLYLYVDAGDDQLQLGFRGRRRRVPNLSPVVIADMEELLGLRFVSEGVGDLHETFGTEDMLHYSYSVFYSPSYRDRYASSLRRDFPRLPLTSDPNLFCSLAALGADLVGLHLLEDDYPAASWNQANGASPFQHPITVFVERATGTTMGSFSKRTCYQNGHVYLDTSQLPHSSYFDGVPEDVWNFHIGGYQVCYKWLYDRRGTGGEPGRTLTPEDIEHYHRIVVALNETIRLMEEIDEVIEAYGGWPIE